MVRSFLKNMASSEKLKETSAWQVENIFTQKWRLEYIYKTIKGYKFENFLEFGCDTGYFTQLIAKISKNVVAIDKNKKAIDYAKETKPCKNVLWLVKDIKEFKIVKDTYEAISFIECITYFDLETRQKLIQNAYLGLKDHGLLLICGAIQLPKWRWGYSESKYFKSFEALESLLTKNNFKIIHKASVTNSLGFINVLMNKFFFLRFLYPLIMKTVNRLPTSFTRNYYVLGQKR